jgi:hypothetical protein
MKLSEIRDKMDGFTEDERAKYLVPLLRNFSPPSKSQMANFQNRWDGSRSFEEFVSAQNNEIRLCIEMELTSVGGDVE